MDLLSQLPLAIALLLASLWLYKQWRSTTQSHKLKLKSPPEPPGAWPLIGHLRLLSGQVPLSRTLGAMADKYGPVFLFRLGVHPVLVVNNWESFKECFTTHDIAFASRPQSSASKYLSYNLAFLGFCSYGSYWRDIRKLVVIQLLSAHRLEQFKHVRVSEIDTSIKELYRLGKTNQPDEAVEITSWIEQLTINIITRMVSGKRYFDWSGAVQDPRAENFMRAIKEFMYVSGNFFSSDVIPYPPLTWVDWGGKLRNVKRIMRELDDIIQSWVHEHVVERRREREEKDEDFIDVMLSEIEEGGNYGHMRDTIIKATVLNLIIAGADTGSINLSWILSILLNNRPALARAREEIDAQIGKTRWVEECDVKNLVYLQAIVKESLRLYPPAPLSVPHIATADCEVGGYHIPKGTRLLPNLWKLHRDPRVWPDPEKFAPERWLAGNHAAGLDVSGKNFEYVPFGAGRRSCPGLALGMHVAQLALARLVQGFEFATPGDEAVDMSEGLGISLPKVKPIDVLITPRLASELYEG
ncbi:nicotine N-demethylase CYP82E3-like [Rhododendron vialii]|uniref:nicotine N-demethylase CYP82E3-like n=1 Tax=Rhododendron vialii TaxID=182163 RepID=UPI00265FC633|nr:nicotine N-demethylase CYP82E3-like [Rhododendron vialii]XP_058206404.1 nicotine N-demethylase CYP82E3-like [Rhododendron vialii]